MKKAVLAAIIIAGVWSVYAGFITVSINKSAIKSAVRNWLQSHSNNKAVNFAGYILRGTWRMARRVRSYLRKTEAPTEAGNFFLPPVMAGT